MAGTGAAADRAPELARWAHELAPRELGVTCGGRRHRVVWRQGRLELVDHPDPVAEEVLAALGGDRPACLDLLGLWRDALADGGFVEEWSQQVDGDPARRAWLLTALGRLRREGIQDFLPSLGLARAERMAAALVCFEPELLDRAALHVAERTLTDGEADSPLRAHFDHAVRRRSRAAFIASLVGSRVHAGTAALVRFSCVVRPGEPAATGRLAGRASWCEVGVDDRWLVDVWGRGLAVVDNRLVLAATAATGEVAALVLDWQRGEGPGLVGALRRAVLVHRDDQWSTAELADCG